MKKIALLSVFVVLFGFATTSFAQDDSLPLSVGVKAGWLWVQDEPLSELVENNWSIGADLKFWFDQFGVGAEVQYLTKDDDGFDFNGTNVDFEYTAIPINVNGYFRVPMEEIDSDAYFYAGGGVSFVFADIMVDDGLNVVDTDDNIIGFNGTVGFQYGMFFVEGQYLWAQWDDDEVKAFFNETDDINVGGFSGWIGVRF